MSYQASSRIHAVLRIDSLNADEKSRENLVNAILSMAPDSPLYGKNPALQQAVTTLNDTYSAYKEASKAAATSRKQAELDATALLTARTANNKALALVRSVAEHAATTGEELQSLAFEVYNGRPPTPALLPPESIDVKPGKLGHGTARVMAHDPGKQQRAFVAESSLDPAIPNSWNPLPGAGKSRTLKGKSGTQVWVRFALVRGQAQSAWSTPVLVTLP